MSRSIASSGRVWDDEVLTCGWPREGVDVEVVGKADVEDGR